jgi:hypothetical protein
VRSVPKEMEEQREEKDMFRDISKGAKIIGKRG